MGAIEVNEPKVWVDLNDQVSGCGLVNRSLDESEIALLAEAKGVVNLEGRI